ncbi:unnamed protein product, partial [Darwinula stevensoni]
MRKPYRKTPPGFSLMETGYVQPKNEINQQLMNVVDICCLGVSYWIVGHGLIYGDSYGTSPFAGVGNFFFATSEDQSGSEYSTYAFELSLAALSATIVSGAIAERVKLHVWLLYNFFSVFIYSIPAGWMWGKHGFLRKMGAVDVAGGCVVHGVGATTALIFTILLGPRNRDKQADSRGIPSANNTLVGFYMLIWGYLGMNCGSTFGVRGTKWHHTAKAAATTITAAMVGFSVALVVSYVVTRYRTGKGRYDVVDIVQGTLGAIVSVTEMPYFCNDSLPDIDHANDACKIPHGQNKLRMSVTGGCAVISPWQSVVIGSLACPIVLAAAELIRRAGVDDVCSVVATNGVAGIWGVLNTGIFSDTEDIGFHVSSTLKGTLYGGGGRLFGVQVLAIVCCLSWAAVTSFALLFVSLPQILHRDRNDSALPLQFLDRLIGLRVSPIVELEGLDKAVHNIVSKGEDWGFKVADLAAVTPPGRRAKSRSRSSRSRQKVRPTAITT